MTPKFQKFIDPSDSSIQLQVLSEYHPEENVWTSPLCLPHEWDTEREMRIDMLIHILSDDDPEMEYRMRLWDCLSEDALLERYEQYIYHINI